MAGAELATEGFKPGQVGSSAMPHKMNARSAERIDGFSVILRGYLTMVGGLLGDQWNEGDVSCSVVRRVAIPDAFLAIDGQLETFLTVLVDFGAYPAVIDRELRRYLPFLATTKILVAAVKAGVGRETAHEAIKEHAVAAALAMRDSGCDDNDLIQRLADDDRIPMDAQTLQSAIGDPHQFIGNAPAQVRNVVAKIESDYESEPQGSSLSPRIDPVVARLSYRGVSLLKQYLAFFAWFMGLKSRVLTLLDFPHRLAASIVQQLLRANRIIFALGSPIRTVWLHDPSVRIVFEIGSQRIDQFLSTLLVVHGNQQFDASVQVPGHPIGAADEYLDCCRRVGNR